MSEKEGVVKYNLEFIEEKLDIQKEYLELESLRKELFSLGLIGAYEDGIGFGNVSIKYKNSEAFIITSTQTGHKKKLGLEDYSKVKSIDFENFKTVACGETKPSSESITHGAIYNLDKNINAVIHIHNEKLWRFMLNEGYLSTNDTPYGTVQMVEDVISMYNNIEPLENNLFVMKGHFEGIVCFGRNIKEAKLKLFSLIKKSLV